MSGEIKELNKPTKNCWKILQFISNLAHGKKIEYEIELKDGLPFKIKNLKIEEVDLTKELREE